MSPLRHITRAAAASLALPLILSVLLSGCQAAAPTAVEEEEEASAHTRSAPAASRAAGDSSLWMEMRNVDLRIDEHAALRIRRLRGEAISTTPGEPVFLDDPESFAIRITSGTVVLTGDDLAALLNGFVFAYRGAPLKRLRVRTAGDQIVQSGIMHKGVDLPFEVTASLSLEPDGRVRLRPTRTRILGINGAKLLRALGLELDDLIDLREARGASVEGNDFFLEPEKFLPPPAINGRLASIRVQGDEIVQDFVWLPEDSVFDTYARPDSAAENYVYFRGGQLRFGKLLMSDTDLQIVDADERDAFDLYLPQYNRQLVAGTSRTLANLGLRVIMPDYRAVAARESAVAAAPGTASPPPAAAP